MCTLLNNNLTFPDGTKFYPDMKDGERRYNTDPARGADTFVPFKHAITPKFIGYVNSAGTYTFGETYDRVIAFRAYDYRASHHTPSCNGIGSVQLISNPIRGINANHTTYLLSDVGVGATYYGVNHQNNNDITFFFAL